MSEDELVKHLEAILARQGEYGVSALAEHHEEADELLLFYINSDKVTEIFRLLRRWYV